VPNSLYYSLTVDLYSATNFLLSKHYVQFSSVTFHLARPTKATQLSIVFQQWKLVCTLDPPFLMSPLMLPKILVMWYYALSRNTGSCGVLLTSLACWFTLLERYLLCITAMNREQISLFLWNLRGHVTLGYVTQVRFYLFVYFKVFQHTKLRVQIMGMDIVTTCVLKGHQYPLLAAKLIKHNSFLISKLQVVKICDWLHRLHWHKNEYMYPLLVIKFHSKWL